MKLSRLISFLGVVSVLMLAGCKKDIDEPILRGLVYVNQTDHPVTVTLQGEELHSKGTSAQIPPRADVMFRVHSFDPFLSSCTFTFDDGKKVVYDLNDAGSNMDSSNPLWLGSYQQTVSEEGLNVLFYFTITDEHYRMAE